MADKFDIIVENAVLQAKTTILEEAAGTQAGQRYVYIVEAAGDTIKKAKDFVKNNKGKLAALAGVAALAGGAAYAYKHHQDALEAQKEAVKHNVETLKNNGLLDDKGNVKPMVDTDPKHFFGKNATGPQDQLNNDKDYVTKAAHGETELNKNLQKSPDELAKEMFKPEKPMKAGTELPSVFNSPRL